MNALKAFDFEAAPVRTIVRQGSPWFVLADVCRVLEIVNPRDAASRLDDDEKSVINFRESSANTVGSSDTPSLRGNPNMNVVSESGLYALIFSSRKAVARRFRKWVTAEVLPALRQTGSYTLDDDEERSWPVSSDGKLWGVRVAKVNAAARMIGVVGRIYGPEAARELYEREPGLPDLRHKTISAMAGTSFDDPVGCIRHLMRSVAGKRDTVFDRLSLAFADRIAAKALKDECGVIVLPKADDGEAVAVENEHDFLARVFADTQWCGAWRDALIDLDGAKLSRPLKAVMIPRALIVDLLAK